MMPTKCWGMTSFSFSPSLSVFTPCVYLCVHICINTHVEWTLLFCNFIWFFSLYSSLLKAYVLLSHSLETTWTPGQTLTILHIKEKKRWRKLPLCMVLSEFCIMAVKYTCFLVTKIQLSMYIYVVYYVFTKAC